MGTSTPRTWRGSPPTGRAPTRWGYRGTVRRCSAASGAASAAGVAWRWSTPRTIASTPTNVPGCRSTTGWIVASMLPALPSMPSW